MSDKDASTAHPAGGRSASGAATAAADHLRVEHLEREMASLRRFSRILLVTLAGFLGFGGALVYVAVRHGMPGFVPEIIESKSFLLRGADGTPRGHFGTGEDGSVQLTFLDASGTQRIALNLQSDNTAGLAFSDDNSRSRFVIALLSDGTTNVVLADAQGQTRAVFGLAPDGSSSLALADKRGITKAGLGVDGVGRPSFTMTERSFVGEEADSTRDPGDR